jgi:hypothetical protein
MNCYIPSGHLLRPAKPTGVDKLRPLRKKLGSGAERKVGKAEWIDTYTRGW